ncbi:MAG: hypothetical protein KDA22_08665, partial [Phycisphaerales bacterium]|nr:hypothetical protein [Phycisphaerales bacterium]
MPRAARYSLPALRDLRRQLQYAPAETRQRQMNAAEALVAEVDPETTYPDDFVLWRITGYRRDSAANPVTFPGDRLLGDLVTLVQEISDSLHLEPNERAGGAVPVEAAAEALGVSLRTLQRYRRLGLLCHVIDFPDGRRLGCFATSLDQFRAREPVRVRSAASFTRLAEADRRAIVSEARELKARGIEALGRVASMLAERHERSPETVRLVLRRHDAQAERPVFRARPVFGARSKRLAERAWRLGVPLSRIAERIGRSEPAVHRHILVWRRDLLAALTLDWIDLPTFAHPEAEEVILAAPSACRRLERLFRGGDAVAVLEFVPGEAPDEESVDAMLAAFNLLKCRAAERIRALSGRNAATAEAVDEAETDLRWAALLKHRLVVLHLPIAWRRIEAQGGQPMLRRVADEIAMLVPLAVRILAATVERA